MYERALTGGADSATDTRTNTRCTGRETRLREVPIRGVQATGEEDGGTAGGGEGQRIEQLS